MELIAAIGEDAGFQTHFMPMALAELIPALYADRIDVIAGNLLITPQRAALVNFSDAIAAGGDDLKGLMVGSQDRLPFAAAAAAWWACRRTSWKPTCLA